MQRIRTQGFFPKKKKKKKEHIQRSVGLVQGPPSGSICWNGGYNPGRRTESDEAGRKEGKPVEGPERQAEGSWPPYVDPWFSNGVPWPSSVP